MLIDIKAVQEQAAKEVNEEQIAEAKRLLKAQMRVVASAERVLAAERIKLNDLLVRLGEGTVV